MSGMSLLITDAHGVYIPRMFAQFYEASDWGFTEDSKDWETVVNGPDTEWYWESWDELLSRASYKDKNGNVWSLHQDGDLWAVCVDLMTDEEYEGYFGEPRENAA